MHDEGAICVCEIFKNRTSAFVKGPGGIEGRFESARHPAGGLEQHVQWNVGRVRRRHPHDNGCFEPFSDEVYNSVTAGPLHQKALVRPALRERSDDGIGENACLQRIKKTVHHASFV